MLSLEYYHGNIKTLDIIFGVLTLECYRGNVNFGMLIYEW